MIDSSPMYGSAQAVIGYGLEKLGRPNALFSADKVWIVRRRRAGADRAVAAHWGVQRFDLLQVHNLLAWEAQLDTLFAMKAAGASAMSASRPRMAAATTVETIMRRHPLDFVQLTYNVVDREVEERLLPLAAERGIAVIVNRPFRQGRAHPAARGRAAAGWAAEIGARAGRSSCSSSSSRIRR